MKAWLLPRAQYAMNDVAQRWRPAVRETGELLAALLSSHGLACFRSDVISSHISKKLYKFFWLGIVFVLFDRLYLCFLLFLS
jgi:hypothetical protein